MKNRMATLQGQSAAKFQSPLRIKQEYDRAYYEENQRKTQAVVQTRQNYYNLCNNIPKPDHGFRSQNLNDFYSR